jgi:quinol monooxygenase YgiN
MTTIDDKNTICTHINVFTVDPSKQQELFDLLKDTNEQVICRQQGYISANIHVSDDKKTVTIYEQWKTVDDWNKMQENPACKEPMQKAAAIAHDCKPVTYNFIYTHSLMDVLMAETAQAAKQEEAGKPA